MVYHVTRNGQNYGPYTLEDLQRYVSSGNVLPTDLAKSDEMAEWATVSQVLGESMPPPAMVTVAPYAGSAMAAYPAGVALYPDPPNLHWALVLLFGMFTCGLFSVVWAIVQAVWMRKANPRSNALFFYIPYAVIYYGGTFTRLYLILVSGLSHMYPGLGIGVGLISLILAELAFFDMRRSMEEHFNGPEPVGLTLSGVMTFFFGMLYFQYHFSRINELKRMARYRGAAI